MAKKHLHIDGCDGIRHLHTIYVKDKEKYQIVLQCKCRSNIRKGRYLYPTHGAAEAAIKAKPIALLFTQRNDSKLIEGTELIVLPVPVVPTAVPPSELEVRAAFIGWWKTICKDNGYESRL